MEASAASRVEEVGQFNSVANVTDAEGVVGSPSVVRERLVEVVEVEAISRRGQCVGSTFSGETGGTIEDVIRAENREPGTLVTDDRRRRVLLHDLREDLREDSQNDDRVLEIGHESFESHVDEGEAILIDGTDHNGHVVDLAGVDELERLTRHVGGVGRIDDRNPRHTAFKGLAQVEEVVGGLLVGNEHIDGHLAQAGDVSRSATDHFGELISEPDSVLQRLVRQAQRCAHDDGTLEEVGRARRGQVSGSGRRTGALTEECNEVGIAAEGGDDLLNEAKSLTLILEAKVAGDSASRSEPAQDTQTIVGSNHDYAAAVRNQRAIVQDRARCTLLKATSRKEDHDRTRVRGVDVSRRENVQRQAVLGLSVGASDWSEDGC